MTKVQPGKYDLRYRQARMNQVQPGKLTKTTMCQHSQSIVYEYD